MTAIVLIVVGVVLTTLLFVGSIGGAFVYELQFSPRARLRRRIKMIVDPGDVSEKKKDKGASAHRRLVQAKLKEMEAQQKQAKKTVTLRMRIQAAGLDFAPANYYLGCVAVAIIAAAIFVAGEFGPWWGAPLVGIPAGYFLPKFFLGFLTGRRQKKFTSQFADGIDVIVRGIQSGLPITECMGIIARESPQPLGDEFKLIIEGQRLGLTLMETLDRACERMPTPEVKFFAIVMNINAQTGGNLAETLGNLSTVLRGRKDLADLIKTKSSEATSTAFIIGSLPFCIGIMLLIMSPEYLLLLFETELGNYMLYGGLVMMTMGALVMKAMINFKV